MYCSKAMRSEQQRRARTGNSRSFEARPPLPLPRSTQAAQPEQAPRTPARRQLRCLGWVCCLESRHVWPGRRRKNWNCPSPTNSPETTEMTSKPPSLAPTPELPCPKHNGENGSSENRVDNSECPARGPFPAVPRRTGITQGDPRGRVAVRRLNVGVWNHGNTRSPNVRDDDE
jgi:hypothetical protein